MIKLQEVVGLPNLQYHLDNKLTLSENTYRYSSEAFVELFAEARRAHKEGKIQLNEQDSFYILETDIGEYGEYNSMRVPLDLPMVSPKYNPLFEIGALIDEMCDDDNQVDEAASIEEMINFDLVKELVESIGGKIDMDKFRQAVRKHNENFEYSGFDILKASVDYIPESEYKGKKVKLNKPKRGGTKKFYVYTKNKKGNIIKVSFGDNNLSVKIKKPGARAAFAARHKCDQKKDRTKPGYWACNITKYWKTLGGDKNYSGYW